MMSTWKRASEITEPGAYWVYDCFGSLYVCQIRKIPSGMYGVGMGELRYWDDNIYLYGPIEPPGEMP